MDTENRSYLLRCVDLIRELPTLQNPARELESNTFRRNLIGPISFEVCPGEVLAVVGASGSGKSSLLRLLNRLDEPTSGRVYVDDIDYRSLPPRQLRHKIGMVTQRPYLFSGTVDENTAYGPAQQGIALTAYEKDQMLASVGLSGYGERSALTLSGGEAQRVAIARALANRPDILLLDEPTSALDEEARNGVERLLASLIRERKLACIWVTHDPAQAARIADRVLRLEAGRVVAIGTAAEVLLPAGTESVRP